MRKPKQIKIKTLLGQPHDDDGDDNDDIDDDDNDDISTFQGFVETIYLENGPGRDDYNEGKRQGWWGNFSLNSN